MNLTFKPQHEQWSWSIQLRKIKVKVTRFKRYSGNKRTDGHDRSH